jgi:hypothetical protein
MLQSVDGRREPLGTGRTRKAHGNFKKSSIRVFFLFRFLNYQEIL